MTENIKHGVFPKPSLTAAELAEIRELASICEAFEGLDLRLSWDELQVQPGDIAADFLYYRAGVLIGFLSLDGLGLKTAEATGMVHPEHRRGGVFRALVAAARAECARNGTESLLFICDGASRSGKAFLNAIGVQYSFAEHKMELRTPAGGNGIQSDDRLDFSPATVDDVPAIARIVAEDTDTDMRQFEQQVTLQIVHQARQYYIARVDGAPIGTINVDVINGDPYIYGFVIQPEYRGRGYGRRMLTRTIEQARGADGRTVFIEVETNNHAALSLYLSCGFEIVNTHEYYRLNLM